MNDLTEPLAMAVRVGATLDALGIDWLVGLVASSIHGDPRPGTSTWSLTSARSERGALAR